MIYSLTGRIIEKTTGEAVIECGGVGYLVAVPGTTASALPAVGNEATLFTVMNVTENDVSLFGFAGREARSMFLMLTSVSGVGPRVALSILSVLDPPQLVLAISAGDFKALTAASGVGPKLAQRLVLELRDKVSALAPGMDFTPGGVAPPPAEAGAQQQAVAALASLGYTPSEAAAAVSKVDAGLPTAEIIRLALKGLGKS